MDPDGKGEPMDESPVGPSPEELAEEASERGKQAFTSNDHVAAIAAYTEAISHNRSEPSTFY